MVQSRIDNEESQAKVQNQQAEVKSKEQAKVKKQNNSGKQTESAGRNQIRTTGVSVISTNHWLYKHRLRKYNQCSDKDKTEIQGINKLGMMRNN